MFLKKEKNFKKMKLFLFSMDCWFFTTWAILLNIHTVWMSFFIFTHCVIFFLTLRTFQDKLNSHTNSSIQSLVYCIIYDSKMQVINDAVSKKTKEAFTREASFSLIYYKPMLFPWKPWEKDVRMFGILLKQNVIFILLF
jgi:hypothetical protein